MTEASRAVFLSYASEDAEAARRICDALRVAGVEVWFDQSELRGGDAWDRQIRKQIHDCTLFVPIISAHSDDRTEGYFRLEWKLAVDRSHLMADDATFLLPVVIDDTPDATARVPDKFRTVQWSRLPAGTASPAFADRVSRLLLPGQAPSALTRTPVGVALAPLRSAPGVAASPWKRPAVLLIATVAVIGVGFFAVDKFWPSKRAAVPVSAPVVKSALPVQSTIPEKSIAVLPFVDMSEKHDQEYFSDGLSEELIDLLTQVQDLRVPARTSSFYFKGQHATIAEIAKALGVSHVLEGSVRRSGNTLRVTAQLIRADSGYHVWSHTFDRDFSDIFKVQDEIAGAVVAALKVKLAPAQHGTNPRGTENIDAYVQYLQGKQFFFHDNEEGYRRAAAAFRQALALDPNYALAYSWLGLAEHHLVGIDEPNDQQAMTNVEKAVLLAPQLAEVYSARGLMRYWHLDWSGAQADIEKALALDADDTDSLRRYGILLSSLGRVPDAIVVQRKAIEIDPLSSDSWSFLGDYYTATGQYAAAREAFKRSNDLAPGADDTHWNLGQVELFEGRAQEALTTFRLETDPETRLAGVAMAEHTLGQAKESQQALDELIAKYGRASPYIIALVYAWRNERGKAIEWLERAYREHDEDIVDIKYDPPLTNLRSDPRYQALLRKLKLPE